MRMIGKRELRRLGALLAAAAAFLAAVCILAGCEAQGASAQAGLPGESDFRIAFLNVGQGDAIYIFSTGRHMLIDAGTGQSAQTVLDFLGRQGLGHSEQGLDLVVATHPHADHIGGMAAVLDAYAVGTFIMPQAVHTTRTFEDMLDAVERNGCDAQYGAAGQSYTLGEATITVLWPQAGEFDGSNLNNASLVLSVEYQGVRMLLVGDAEAEVEAALVEAGLEPHALLKVGHHGSRTSSTQAFLDAVQPAHAVISCGAGNDYGHPHDEVLERLGEARVWRTDLGGTVSFDIEEGQLYAAG